MCCKNAKSPDLFRSGLGCFRGLSSIDFTEFQRKYRPFAGLLAKLQFIIRNLHGRHCFVEAL